MLGKEDNELLTRVGAGTPMGEMLRQYWIPVMLSEELAQPDGAPLRVRLLGEDLVMFRDTNGAVGLLGDHCSHRGASLFFGRNEECGIRCVYHGWKYDVAGNCVDMPNEPPESNFKDKIHHLAYPCREYGGMIWTYMGPRSVPPQMPQLEWALIPQDHRNLTPVLRECNWVQALEGDIDTAHLYFLHARLDPDEDRGPQNDNGVYHEDRHPRLHLIDMPYGIMYGAQRDEGPDNHYWRITQFMFPFHTYFPPGGFAGVPGHIWVPLDDYNTMVWSVSFNPISPVQRRQLWNANDASQFLPPTSDGLGRWRAVANKANDYLIDRDVQRTKTFTGIPTIPLQDQAVTESMGPIYDRSTEHLSTTDATIIQVRRKLLNAAKALRDSGTTPPGVENPEWYGVRSASLVLPRDADWVRETSEHLKAFTSLPVATV
jgi:phthalate 4,5-dioxygenase